MQKLVNQNGAQNRDLEAQVKTLKMEKKQLLIDQESQKKQIKLLDKKLQDSEMEITKNKQYTKQIKTDLLTIKMEMTEILDENAKLKQKDRKARDQKVYMKSNLEAVLAAIRNNLSCYDKRDKLSLSSRDSTNRHILETKN